MTLRSMYFSILRPPRPTSLCRRAERTASAAAFQTTILPASPREFTLWLFAHGVMPLYTPLGGSWLNVAESIQRVLKRRALDGQEPASPAEIMERFAAVARHWNAAPTPFVWGGKRAARRKRERDRRHAVGGSGAYTRRPIRRRNGHGRGK